MTAGDGGGLSLLWCLGRVGTSKDEALGTGGGRLDRRPLSRAS